jgi:hypothetical protein
VRFRDPAGSVRTGERIDDGVAFGTRTCDEDEIEIEGVGTLRHGVRSA